MNGNQNLSREILYERLHQVIFNLESTLNIESITKSKIGNKLSAIYQQLVQIQDTCPIYNTLLSQIYKLLKEIRARVVEYFIQPNTCENKTVPIKSISKIDNTSHCSIISNSKNTPVQPQPQSPIVLKAINGVVSLNNNQEKRQVSTIALSSISSVTKQSSIKLEDNATTLNSGLYEFSDLGDEKLRNTPATNVEI